MIRIFLLCFTTYAASAQVLGIKGTITCTENKPQSETPIGPILLTPRGEPQVHGISDNGNGFYEFTLSRDLKSYKQLNIFWYGGNKVKDVESISLHKETLLRINSVYFIERNILLKKNCEHLKLSANELQLKLDSLDKADSLLKKKNSERIAKRSPWVLTLAPVFSLLGAGGKGGPQNYDSTVVRILPIKIKNVNQFSFGNSERLYFNKYSFNLGRSTLNSTHGGDSPLLNPTNTLGAQGLVVGLSSNSLNYFLPSVYYSHGKSAVGIGALINQQKPAAFSYSVTGLSAEGSANVSASEVIYFTSLAREITSKLNLGTTLKVRRQVISSVPASVRLTNNYKNGRLDSLSELVYTDKASDAKFDFDVAGAYKVGNRFRVITTIKNILNTSALVSNNESTNIFKSVGTRSLLVGLDYSWKGSELGGIIWYDKVGFVASIGIKHSFHPNFTLQVGSSTLDETISVGATFFRAVGLAYMHSDRDAAFQASLYFTPKVRKKVTTTLSK